MSFRLDGQMLVLLFRIVGQDVWRGGRAGGGPGDDGVDAEDINRDAVLHTEGFGREVAEGVVRYL